MKTFIVRIDEGDDGSYKYSLIHSTTKVVQRENGPGYHTENVGVARPSLSGNEEILLHHLLDRELGLNRGILPPEALTLAEENASLKTRLLHSEEVRDGIARELADLHADHAKLLDLHAGALEVAELEATGGVTETESDYQKMRKAEGSAIETAIAAGAPEEPPPVVIALNENGHNPGCACDNCKAIEAAPPTLPDPLAEVEALEPLALDPLPETHE